MGALMNTIWSYGFHDWLSETQASQDRLKGMSRMTVKELFEKYCERTEDGEYVVQGHCVRLCPATAEELHAFKEMCRGYLLRYDAYEEMAAFYAQTNSFLGYHKCDDEALFEWWKPKHHEVWLGSLDCMVFVYDDLEDIYGIRYATETECFAKYKSLMEMLEAIVSDNQARKV